MYLFYGNNLIVWNHTSRCVIRQRTRIHGWQFVRAILLKRLMVAPPGEWWRKHHRQWQPGGATSV